MMTAAGECLRKEHLNSPSQRMQHPDRPSSVTNERIINRMISNKDILIAIIILEMKLKWKIRNFHQDFFFCNKNISIWFFFWAIFYPLNIFFIISLYIIAYIFSNQSNARKTRNWEFNTIKKIKENMNIKENKNEKKTD